MKAESFVRAPVLPLGGSERAGALLAAGSVASTILMGSIAVLVQRRLAGVLVDPLSASALVVVALLLVPLAGATAATLNHLFARRASSARGMNLALATLILAGMLAIAVPETSTLAWLVGAIAWLAASVAVTGNERIGQWVRSAQRWFPSSPIAQRGARARFNGLTTVTHADEREIVQKLVRRQISADGAERIEGTLRCEFAPGQRTAMAHVAFCPPLPALPKIDARLSTPPSVEGTCKVAELYVHAARFEVRLTTPAHTACLARVAFTAISDPHLERDDEGFADGTFRRDAID